jgi:outer membrane protein TolC
MDGLQALPLEIDRVAAVRTGLENRAELAEARLAVDNSALVVGQAKNQALPRLDLLFQYRSSGLGINADRAFSQWTSNNFINYVMALDLEIPVGNRERRATVREARLRHAQAIASQKSQTEQVILEVNSAARAAQTEFDSISPSIESADANEDQVNSVIARQERKDFAALNQELNARRSLAGSRSALLDDLVQYNIALAALERAKGTLLGHNNIVIAELEGD